VPTHAPRYLTGQSISLSREIIPGGGGDGGGDGNDDGDDDDGDDETTTTTTTMTVARATFGLDNYPRVIVYTLYTSRPAITRFSRRRPSAVRARRASSVIGYRFDRAGKEAAAIVPRRHWAKIWILLPPV